ncbi:MAG: carboxymuconolactone decarboxylase family protein [Burkholderiales bacterium]|nr:carboxymuconolactone decarboxylase family protein [Burkholderiales bacterium]
MSAPPPPSASSPSASSHPASSHPAPRIDSREFYALAPEAVAALRALGSAVEAAGLDRGMLELVKLRASQINGCGYCVQYHLNLARSLGVPQVKLDLACVWREAGVFSGRECAALAWTEALTARPADGAPDDLYAALCAEFTRTEIAALTAAIANINAWNRIAAPLRFAPPIPA